MKEYSVVPHSVEGNECIHFIYSPHVCIVVLDESRTVYLSFFFCGNRLIPTRYVCDWLSRSHGRHDGTEVAVIPANNPYTLWTSFYFSIIFYKSRLSFCFQIFYQVSFSIQKAYWCKQFPSIVFLFCTSQKTKELLRTGYPCIVYGSCG